MSTLQRAEQRRAQFRASILEQLGETAVAEERVRQLCQRLSEYVDRWSGFATMPHIQMASLADGDLFWAIEVATDLMTAELDAWVPPLHIRRLWQEYRETLGQINRTSAKDVVRDLGNALEAVCTGIQEIQ